MGGAASTIALPQELEGKDVYTIDEIKTAFGESYDETKAEEILKSIDSREAISREVVEAALGLKKAAAGEAAAGEVAAGEAAAGDAAAGELAAGDSATGAAPGPAAPAVSDGVTVLQWNVAGINSNAFEFLQEDEGLDDKDPFSDVLVFAGKLDVYLGTIAGKIKDKDEKATAWGETLRAMKPMDPLMFGSLHEKGEEFGFDGTFVPKCKKRSVHSDRKGCSCTPTDAI